MTQRKKPELLLPARNAEVLRCAIRFGADAVYIGGEVFGLRAKAENFTLEEMDESIRFAHEAGAKVYVTVNILARNGDLSGVRRYLSELLEISPDGLIIADPAVFMLAKEICPFIPRHISTQANSTNYGTFRFWKELGASRVVTARELSIAEIKEIQDKTPDGPEIETFVHGAMCISYSGRCLLSNYFTGKDANRGACTHPCRWNYAVAEATRPGEYLPIEENERGTFVFNSKDLCMIAHIPELVEAGIDSFKIEGRMKNALYVANAARTYRQAIDDYFADPALYRERLSYYREEISHCANRQFTTGFFFGRADEMAQIYDEGEYRKDYTYLGPVLAVDEKKGLLMVQHNKFSVGETIEIMCPDGTDRKTFVHSIMTEDGIMRDSAPHAKERVWVKTNAKAEAGDILRREEAGN